MRRPFADDITETAIVALAKAGVEIPYPKRALNDKQGAGVLPDGGQMSTMIYLV